MRLEMKKLLLMLATCALSFGASADIVLRQSTASQAVQIGPFVDSTGAVLSGLTISNTDVRLSKNGADIVAKNSGGCTYDESGMYTCTFDATDSSATGRLQVTVVETGALPVYHEFQVATAAVFDACCGSSGAPLTATDVWGAAARTLTAATNITSTGAAVPITSSRVDVSVGAYQSGLAPLQPTVAGRTLDVTTTGGAGIDWANVESPTTSLTLSGTTVGTATALTNLPTIPTAWITANGVATDAIGAAELAADAGTEIGTATWASTTRLLTAGTNIVLAKGTGITGFNDIAATDVWAAGTRTLTAGTNINGSTFTSIPWNASWDAEVQSEANDALTANFLDRIFAADYDPATKPGVSTALFNELIESDAGVSRFTANALEQGPAGGGGGTADWTADERTAIRSILGVPGSGTTPADPTVGILDTTRDLVADVPTNAELATALNGLNDLSSAEDQTAATAALNAYDGPTNTELAAALATADDATLAAIAALNNLSLTQVRSMVVEDQGTTVGLGCVNAVALAVLAGRASVSGSTVTYRDPSNNEIRAVVTHDSTGNRSSASITCPSY
jgi:hypothetical protein